MLLQRINTFSFLKKVTAAVALLFIINGCQHINLYEKVTAIPGHEWKSNYAPKFQFQITDTTSPYQLYFSIRHGNAYNYNNVWVAVTTTSPDGTKARAQYELPLANNERGWLGTGMDDLYEHRIALTPPNLQFYFKQAGTYTFTVQHLMREDPLQAVWNVGLRVEKKSK